MATNSDLDSAMEKTPARQGANSVERTTASPLLKTATNRAFKSNGPPPRRTDIRKGTRA